MALRGREITLSYEIPHSVQFNPQQNKTSNYQSPVEFVQFLWFLQQDFANSTWNFPNNRVYFSKWKFTNTSTSQHEDLHILNSNQGSIFPNRTAMQQISSHTHTLHPYIINIDKANASHHTFHTTWLCILAKILPFSG